MTFISVFHFVLNNVLEKVDLQPVTLLRTAEAQVLFLCLINILEISRVRSDKLGYLLYFTRLVSRRFTPSNMRLQAGDSFSTQLLLRHNIFVCNL